MIIKTVTLAIPSIVVLDICSASVDIPWWAYLIILFCACIRWTRVDY